MQSAGVSFLGVGAIIALLSFSSPVVSYKRKYEDRFLDYGIYTIMNRGLEKQFLTFLFNVTGNQTASIVIPPEMRFAGSVDGGQKWRLDQSALYTAFELRPILNENYVLEYIPDQGILRWLSGWRNTKLWYLQDAGDNFTMIKHKRYSVCLQATENKPVLAKECDGNIYQQWKLLTGPDSA